MYRSDFPEELRLVLYQNSIDLLQIKFYYTRIIQYTSRLSSYLLQQAGASADWVNRAKTLDKQTSTSRKRKILYCHSLEFA